MKFSIMFKPIQIGSVTVPNRFVVPPMGNNLANPDGTLSDRSLAYYTARAKGGFGLITIESTVVYYQAKGGPHKPCLFSDYTIASFRQVAENCHRYGAKVSIQLQHAGPEGKFPAYRISSESSQFHPGFLRQGNTGSHFHGRTLPCDRVLWRRSQKSPAGRD